MESTPAPAAPSTDGFVIRDAVPGDARDFALTQILAWRAAYRGILEPEFLAGMDEDRLTEQWNRNIANLPPGSRQLALSIDGVVVGWSGFGTPREEAEPGMGELKMLNLSPAAWGRGLGSELFRTSLTGLRGLGYKRAYLWVADGNRRAIDFYERHGWSADGTLKDDARFTPALRELRYVATLS